MYQPLHEKLKPFVIDNPFVPMQDALLQAKLGLSSNPLLSRKNAALGLLLARYTGNSSATDHHAHYHESEKDKQYAQFWELLGPQEWDTPEHKDLLVFLLGEETATWAIYAWKQIPFQMYQRGYARRSFRAPDTPDAYRPNQYNFLMAAMRGMYHKQWEHNKGYLYTFLRFPSPEAAMENDWLVGEYYTAIPRLWAAAIDNGHTSLLETARTILYNQSETGKVTRNILKALLLSHKQEAWKLVEDLLLAARQQEGLRQTILEALDETSTGALRYMTDVVVREKLLRFSSVVRAADVWVGLGWESARESAIEKVLSRGLYYLDHPDQIVQAVASQDNQDVFMALWAQGVAGVEKTQPLLQQLMQSGQRDKMVIAVYFAAQTGLSAIAQPILLQGLQSSCFEAQSLATVLTWQHLHQDDFKKDMLETYPQAFETMLQVHDALTVKQQTVSGVAFEWLSWKFEKKMLLGCAILLVNNDAEKLSRLTERLEEMDADNRGRLTRLILPEWNRYSYDNEKPQKRLTTLQRRYALQIVPDRTEYSTGIRALMYEPLSSEELATFPDLFRRKTEAFRTALITLVMQQTPEKIAGIIDTLLKEGDEPQRLAALDMIQQWKTNRLGKNQLAAWISLLAENKKRSAAEQVLIDELTGNTTDPDAFKKEKGYGLYNPEKLYPVTLPAIDEGNVYEQLCRGRQTGLLGLASRLFQKKYYAFSMPADALLQAFTQLESLVEQHRHHAYEVENYDGTRETVLLGNTFRAPRPHHTFPDDEAWYNSLPLPEVWKAWYAQSGLTPADLFLIHVANHVHPDDMSQYLQPILPVGKPYLPEKYRNIWPYQNHLIQIADALHTIYPYDEQEAMATGACLRLFRSLPVTVLEYEGNDRWYGSQRRQVWQDMASLKTFLAYLPTRHSNKQLLRQSWEIWNWYRHSAGALQEDFIEQPFELYCECYQAGIIASDDLLKGIIHPGVLQQLTGEGRRGDAAKWMETYPFLQEFVQQVVNHILNIEIKRGDSATPVTPFAMSIQKIYGSQRLFQLLTGLGKLGFHRGYYYGYGDTAAGKQVCFSTLIKRCYPLPADTQENFSEAVKTLRLTDAQLVGLAMYAPQWQPFISRHLSWDGLDSAIWWMHAHTKTDTWQAMSPETESELARHSTIDVDSFKEGAVDKEWFWQAFETIGATRWPLVYDAAKYISDGNGHRRARIYADVLQGTISLKEVAEKIHAKRDQDYVRVYGLAPLLPEHKETQLLERYNLLEQFKKESRQFGAQKQASEANAYRVGMENLARNAGYPDPIRLQWAMETRQVKQILSLETQVQYDQNIIGLIVDEDGMADVVAFSGEKRLKAIPAKYKKDKKVAELLEYRKTLREQHRRARKSLEDAMVRGDELTPAEVANLFDHPVIAPQVRHLVWVATRQQQLVAHGFYTDGSLYTTAQDTYPITGDMLLRIAHVTYLKETGAWPAYQQYLFQGKMVQPFKQVFRELYVPTADEIAAVAESSRYAGHQIQPKKTLALLKTRGWKFDYESGLQKLFRNEKLVAKMYAMADWFTPAEVEAPTLETVVFHHSKTWKKVPLTEIPPRIFSEVMRDMDLVVSVAHAGNVDPEASHSTIEMRQVLLEETARLFKWNNIRIQSPHCIIKGKLGEYSVHLGSGIAHKMASGALWIIPVHSQHRGRIFLPFADEDPRMAEIITKVMLLAEDHKIQDPTILEQLNR